MSDKWEAGLAESRREHSFENHMQDDVTELINAGRAIIAASLKDAPSIHEIQRFEIAAENAARELAIVGRDIVKNLTARVV